ncbi:unnamed protein product [Urochloa humidicola]
MQARVASMEDVKEARPAGSAEGQGRVLPMGMLKAFLGFLLLDMGPVRRRHVDGAARHGGSGARAVPAVPERLVRRGGGAREAGADGGAAGQGDPASNQGQ